MMDDNIRNRASISTRPTHGTAPLINIPSILPQTKRQQEVFWVNSLVTQLSEYKGYSYQVFTNKNDSSGNHDVILEVDGNKIGIQVTELTYELMRRRVAIRKRYIEKLINELEKRQIIFPIRVVVNILFCIIDAKRIELVEPNKLIDIILDNLNGITERKIYPFAQGTILLDLVTEGNIYIPSYGNIGIDVNFDQLERSLDTYYLAIEHLAKKKVNSKSPWLLIWSLGFWRDKHWLGPLVIQYMQETFQCSTFEKVYFLESIDGDHFFPTNLALHLIKE